MGEQAMTPTASPPTPRSKPLDALGDLPITPPQSPRLDLDNRSKESKISLSTTCSRRSTRSHQEYLDSLKPPSAEEFARLAKVQEEREKEHRRRNQSLQNQSASLAYKSMEARHDFAEAQQQQHQQQNPHRLQNVIAHLGSGTPAVPAAESSSSSSSSDSLGIQSRAATLIQRSYRGYRVRREMKGLGLDAGTRWAHAIRDAQWKQLNEPRPRADSTAARISGSNMDIAEDDGQQQQQQGGTAPRSSSSTVARQNWRKATKIAMRAGGDEDSSHSDDDSDSSSDEGSSMSSAEQRAAERQKRVHAKEKRRKKAKMMGLQYFLEMVDLKHRYGSNLRQYHEQWKKADTNENFFYWLDHGDGKNIELATCPRDRLEREQVRYLSREERQNYLVKVDSEGRLCWAKNGVRIDTTEQWKDSINGIVPVDDSTPAFAPSIESHSQSHDDDTDSDNTSSQASESELEAARAAKYATPSLDDAKGLKKVKHVSAATIFNKLLRKSVRKNTWIFVADTSFRLYVGIKASGSFQHSSFLQGARISAAGLIKIKNGRLTSLSPLSGHYRPPASSFRAFVHGLRDQGVDMHRVSISKSYAVLVGLEAYVKTRAKGREALRRATRRKERLLDPEQAARRAEAEKDKSHSAALERRAVEREHEQQRAEDEERRRDENRGAVKIMQKLGIRPSEPPVQKREEEAAA